MTQKRSSEPVTKRRGRPRAYDPKVAIARATATFWKEGYAATSLDDLSAGMGMNRPSLYAAFGDKRELYFKTLEHYRDEARALVRGVAAEDLPLRVFLKRFYRKALDIFCDGGPRGCYLIGTATTVAGTDERVRAFLSESIRGADEFLRQKIARGKESGEVAAWYDAATLACIATAMLHTLSVRARAGASRRALEKQIDAVIEVICAVPVAERSSG